MSTGLIDKLIDEFNFFVSFVSECWAFFDGFFPIGTKLHGLLWVKLAGLDFSPGAGVRKLQLDGQPDVIGNQTANFKPAVPFPFLAPH
jgi:hypothetical protein